METIQVCQWRYNNRNVVKERGAWSILTRTVMYYEVNCRYMVDVILVT